MPRELGAHADKTWHETTFARFLQLRMHCPTNSANTQTSTYGFRYGKLKARTPIEKPQPAVRRFDGGIL